MQRAPLAIALPLLLSLTPFLIPSALAQTFNPSISVTPSSVQCGQSVTVTGTDFPASTTVTVGIEQLVDTVEPVDVDTDPGGTLPATTFAIPGSTTPGLYTVEATGSFTAATQSLTV